MLKFAGSCKLSSNFKFQLQNFWKLQFSESMVSPDVCRVSLVTSYEIGALNCPAIYVFGVHVRMREEVSS